MICRVHYIRHTADYFSFLQELYLKLLGCTFYTCARIAIRNEAGDLGEVIYPVGVGMYVLVLLTVGGKTDISSLIHKEKREKRKAKETADDDEVLMHAITRNAIWDLQ